MNAELLRLPGASLAVGAGPPARVEISVPLGAGGKHAQLYFCFRCEHERGYNARSNLTAGCLFEEHPYEAPHLMRAVRKGQRDTGWAAPELRGDGGGGGGHGRTHAQSYEASLRLHRRRAHLIAQMWGHRAICFSAHAAPPAGAPPLKMQAQLVGHLKPAQAKLRPMTQQGRQQQASSGMPRIAVRPKTSLSAR